MQYDDDDVVGDGIAGDGKWQVRKFGGWIDFLNAVGIFANFSLANLILRKK